MGGWKVAVLVEDNYENLELWYPVLRLREAGASVEIVGPEAERVYKSKEGYPAKADVAAKDARARAAEYDAVIVPGGYAPDRMRRNEDLVGLVRRAHEAGRVVAAICHAGWVLAEADIVRGRRLTCVPAIQTDMKNAGAEYVNEEVVVDGNLVTSRIPPDLPAFCREILRLLAEGSGSGSVAAGQA